MFHLVYGDLELTLPLPFEADVEARLVGILERVSQPLDPDDRSKIEFTQKMVAVVTALVEGNVVPPSEKQT